MKCHIFVTNPDGSITYNEGDFPSVDDVPGPHGMEIWAGGSWYRRSEQRVGRMVFDTTVSIEKAETWQEMRVWALIL